MKLRRVDICETVGRFLYGALIWRGRSESAFPSTDSFAGIRHVSRDIHQARNRWIRARFRNHGSPIAMTDKDARSVLECEDTLHGSYIVLERSPRLL